MILTPNPVHPIINDTVSDTVCLLNQNHGSVYASDDDVDC